MELGLTNKVVLVTGGTRGIGLQIVKDFLLSGAKVLAVAKNNPSNLIFQELLEQYKGYLFFLATDVTIDTELEKCFEFAKYKFGQVDVVISNVGNGSSSSNPISDEKQWKKVWDLNFNPAVSISRIFSPELKKNSGSLLFISSIAGMESIGAPTDYSTAKSALITFSKMLSRRLAPEIRVNVIAPGNILTEDGTWTKKMAENPEMVTEMLNKQVPLKRFGHPEEISSAVLFLSSTKASFITGACLVIDGGQTISFH